MINPDHDKLIKLFSEDFFPLVKMKDVKKRTKMSLKVRRVKTTVPLLLLDEQRMRSFNPFFGKFPEII